MVIISIIPDFAETLPTAYPWLAGVPVCTRWIRMDIGGESFTIEPYSGAETALLVEDEDALRTLVLEILDTNGYTIL